MSRLRAGRRKYYDLFSHFYDAFIRLHARQDEDNTRRCLAEAANFGNRSVRRILDVCCGRGAVLLDFAERYPDASFNLTSCSHALYELKAEAREQALWR